VDVTNKLTNVMPIKVVFVHVQNSFKKFRSYFSKLVIFTQLAVYDFVLIISIAMRCNTHRSLQFTNDDGH